MFLVLAKRYTSDTGTNWCLRAGPFESLGEASDFVTEMKVGPPETIVVVEVVKAFQREVQTIKSVKATPLEEIQWG